LERPVLVALSLGGVLSKLRALNHQCIHHRLAAPRIRQGFFSSCRQQRASALWCPTTRRPAAGASSLCGSHSGASTTRRSWRCSGRAASALWSRRDNAAQARRWPSSATVGPRPSRRPSRGLLSCRLPWPPLICRHL
jgi:hypothetical protein